MVRRRGRVERLVARLPRLRAPRPGVAVLCYHSVERTGAGHQSATPRQFGDHLDWLAEHARVIPLRDLFVPQPDDDDRPTVSITFDDGYRDNHEIALPALVERGLTATFFVTSGFIDGDRQVSARMAAGWSDPPPTLAPMSWGQVDELMDAGMEVGGHTRTHRDLAGCHGRELAREIAADRERIAARTGRPPTSFAYPFGRPGHHVTAETVESAESAGYRTAVTVSFRRATLADHPFAVPRIPVNHDDVDLLAAKCRGRLDPLGTVQDGRALDDLRASRIAA
ncbi:MAG: polysaccharide deacetylase family protein [Actinomycetota bacterium]